MQTSSLIFGRIGYHYVALGEGGRLNLALNLKKIQLGTDYASLKITLQKGGI